MTIFYDISFSMKKSKKFLKMTPFFFQKSYYTPNFYVLRLIIKKFFFLVDDPLKFTIKNYGSASSLQYHVHILAVWLQNVF